MSLRYLLLPICCFYLLNLAQSLECGACVDGKVATNQGHFNIRVPKKGVYPYCKYGSARLFVNCTTSCMAVELMKGREVHGMARMCADDAFFKNTAYYTDKTFEPFVLKSVQGFTLHSRVCNKRLCNLDAVFYNSKAPSTEAPQMIMRLETSSTSVFYVWIPLLAVLL